ncbi:chemotaxis protein [Roseibium aquae]|uniref:Chemotaxis protein n=1 Tax=Roseibium aquae TaxID=1323746 RepID=A0A916WZP8_9HYPH|nr:methyl-accepting chemotaxis protein [Roseibium aquae]GGB42486.1 chemotaxis protein [Roseibium aquae]
MVLFNKMRSNTRLGPAHQDETDTHHGPDADPTDTPGQAGKSADRGTLTLALDMIEDDLHVAARNLNGIASDVQTAITAQFEVLEQIRQDGMDLAAQTNLASQNATGLAESIDALTTSSAEIESQMDRSSALSDQALDVAGHANQEVEALRNAILSISEVVTLISDIAKQTNLLALNATIEAARAGEAGKGFAVVASEVKALSVETQRATDQIVSNIDRLQQSAETSIASVNRIVDVIGEIRPSFAAVEAAVQTQISTTNEIGDRARETASFVDQVRGRANTINDRAVSAEQRGQTAQNASERLGQSVEALRHRFTMMIRQSAVGDRRQQDRLPVRLTGTMAVGGKPCAVETRDISEGGTLVHAEAAAGVRPGLLADLNLNKLGTVRVRVVEQSDVGLHCAFVDPDPRFTEALGDLLAEIHGQFAVYVERAQTGAQAIAAAMTGMIEKGSMSVEALFDTDYAPIPGTNPQQVTTRSLSVLESILPPIQEDILKTDQRMAFCAAVDRNGYLPVHNRIYSHPQRSDDPAWNTANSRNKRIFDDRAGLSAGRNTRPFLIQSYARDMGNGKTVWMTEIDAPIYVNGRQWGGFRTAYKQ